MTNTQAAEVIKSQLRQHERQHHLAEGFRRALTKAVMALEHSPELPDDYDQIRGVECNVCHWRTLRKDVAVCERCGGHDMGAVYNETSNIGHPEGSDIGRHEVKP